MPHIGLEKLEILRIQNTHTLKTIPSVYAFQVSWGHGLLIRGLFFPSYFFLYTINMISLLLNNQIKGSQSVRISWTWLVCICVYFLYIILLYITYCILYIVYVMYVCVYVFMCAWVSELSFIIGFHLVFSFDLPRIFVLRG